MDEGNLGRRTEFGKMEDAGVFERRARSELRKTKTVVH
jgi:hypothetical protein